MAPDDPFLSDEDFRYAAECRRLARLARPISKRQRRIDIAGYMQALESLGQLWRGVADQPRLRSMSARR